MDLRFSSGSVKASTSRIVRALMRGLSADPAVYVQNALPKLDTLPASESITR